MPPPTSIGQSTAAAIRLDRLEVLRFAGLGSVQVDHVDAFGPAVGPALCGIDRIVDVARSPGRTRP